jgi:hypothetical protein
MFIIVKAPLSNCIPTEGNSHFYKRFDIIPDEKNSISIHVKFYFSSNTYSLGCGDPQDT